MTNEIKLSLHMIIPDLTLISLQDMFHLVNLKFEYLPVIMEDEEKCQCDECGEPFTIWDEINEEVFQEQIKNLG